MSGQNTPRGGADWRNERALRAVIEPTPKVSMGVGTEVGEIPDDAQIDGAATVPALAAQVVRLARVNRFLLRQLSRKGIITVED